MPEGIMLEKFNKFTDVICKIIKYFVALLVVAAITVSFAEVVRRYLFSKVFVWSDEFIRFVLIYVGMVGGAAAYRYGQLVCFDSLLNRLDDRMKFVFGIASDLISFVLIVFCFYLSIKNITAKSVVISVSTGMKVPMTVPYFAFVLGFALMMLFCVNGFMNRIADYAAKKGGAK